MPLCVCSAAVQQIMLPLDKYEYVHQQPIYAASGWICSKAACATLACLFFSSLSSRPMLFFVISPNMFSPKLRGKWQWRHLTRVAFWKFKHYTIRGSYLDILVVIFVPLCISILTCDQVPLTANLSVSRQPSSVPRLPSFSSPPTFLQFPTNLPQFPANLPSDRLCLRVSFTPSLRVPGYPAGRLLQGRRILGYQCRLQSLSV